jgi:hypothetical protein
MQSTQSVPVEYSNVNVDKDGFIYGTVSSYNVNGSVNENIFVQKLNPTGKDVLKRKGFFSIMGDINYSNNNKDPELAQITDIALRDSGIYSILGKQSGRVYTYDDNGNLMYIFGGLGTSLGQFSLPVALDVINNDEYLVVDRNYNQILMFKPTEYGNMITNAARTYYKRDYEKSGEMYKDILKYTVKSDNTYDGMGRAVYRSKDYVSAMAYYKLCDDKAGYSEAYKYYRTELINKYFNFIIIAAIIIIIGIIILRIYLKKRRVKGE